MQSNLSEEFMDISHLTCWYQPIYEINNNKILGYESLMRSKSNKSINTLEIFKAAGLLGMQTNLDKLLIIKAQQLFKNIKDNLLFINILPSTLLEKDFLFWWKENCEISDSIVLEISEIESIDNIDYLKLVINELRKRNIKIAIDDLGTGCATIQLCIELEPEFIKLDRYFMIDLDKNIKKQKVIESCVKLTDGSSKIIIEGVENIKDLIILRELGIQYAQGYALGMPSPINHIEDNNRV